MNEKNIKIAMFGHKCIPSCEGGVEVVVGELSVRMAKLGFDITCYNRKNKKRKISSDVYKDVKLKEVFTINKKGLAAVTSSFIASILCSFGRYDVVHIHAEGPSFMCWLPKLMKKKVIVTIHGLDHLRAKWGKFASWYILKGEKNAVKYADKIIVLSEATKKYFKDKYNRETVYIPNGIEKPALEIAEIITKKYKLNKDDYILYLGRIVPEKGISYLIEAYKNIETNKKLVIAGGSSDTDEYYTSLIENAKNDERIIFTGFVKGKEKSELYSNAYIYCLPSDLEGMPISLLEAMSYGNCCLTSDIKECEQVIEDKGVTFNKANIKDLQLKLTHLINNKKIVENYKRESMEFVLGKYNWDIVVNDTINTYIK